MRVNDKQAEQLYEEMKDQKQISSLAFELQDFKNWLLTIQHVSDMPYKKKMLGDYDLDEFLIPAALAELVIPRKISIERGDDFVNLRGTEKDVKLTGHIIDAPKFCSISKGIQASQRKATKEMKNLQDLSKEMLITDIGTRYYTDGVNCVKQASPYVPIKLTIQPVERDFLSTKVDKMLLLWFNRAIMTIAE